VSPARASGPAGGRPPAPRTVGLWRPLAARPAAGSEGPDDPVLRSAVVGVHLSALAALAVAGVLPPPVMVLAVAVAVGFSLLARACLTRPGLGPLRIGLWGATALVTVVVPFALVLAGGAASATALGVFVAGFLAATSADQDGTRRAMLTNLVLGLAVLALAAGLGPFLRPGLGAGLAVPVVAGWTAALVALVRAARRYPVAAAPVRVAADAPAAGRAPTPWWRGPVAGVVTVTMLVSLLAFAVVSRLPDSAVADPAASGDGGFLGGSGPGTGAAPRSVGSTYSGGSLDLRSRGDLPDEPVMLVPQGSPTLWRSAVLDVYTGAAWAQPGLAGGDVDPVRGTVDLTDPDDPALPGAAARTDAVRWLAPGPFSLPRPGVARSVTLAGSDRAVRAVDGTVVVPHGGDGSGSDDEVGFTVASLGRPEIGGTAEPGTAGPDRLRAAASGGGPVADDPQGADAGRWLQLPGTLPGRVRDLGVRLAAQPTRFDAVRAVEDHLRATATYRLDAPVPDEDADAVDHFLFESHEGYCEQFASAEVVLLRSAGIPARLAVGFAGGEPAVGPDGAPAEPGVAGDLTGARLVRGTQAHAWVEVWFPQVGWVSSDPTAGTTLADPPALDRLGRWLREHAVVLVVGVLALAAAAGAAVLLVRRRRGRDAAPGPGRWLTGGAADLVAAFDRLGAALDRAGAPRRTEETLAELGARLARGDERYLGDGDAGRLGPAAALAVLERLLYAATPPPAADLRAAAEALDALSARVLAAAREPQPTPGY